MSLNSWNGEKNVSCKAENMDILRGEEGQAANTYFEVFDHLILHQKEDFPFDGRNCRPSRRGVD